MRVGDIIKKLRKENKMTLSDLSQKSGIALATLSRMENCKMIGTLNSHMKICEALSISLPDLYKELPSSKKVVEVRPRQTVSKVSVHDKKCSSIMLASGTRNKHMLPLLVSIMKGGRTPTEENGRGSEKFVYVVDGKIEANIGEEKYNLSPKDTIYFDAYQAHHFRNAGTGEAHIIAVVCCPNP